MNKHDRIYELIQKLNYYNKLYDEGRPEITDKEYDDLYFELESLEKETGLIFGNSPTQHIDFKIVNQLNKVEHNHPMLSLDKTKNLEEVLDFMDNKDCVGMAKMDGLTCSLHYIDGKLISAETRGDGTIGEDILNNIKFVKGVPIELDNKDELIIDGEVICTYEDFESFNSDYKNPRNFASGSIRLLDSQESAQRKLTFVAWDCIKGLDVPTLNEKLVALTRLGFLPVPWLNTTSNFTIDKLEHMIYLLKDWAQSESYPIDGIVFKYNDCAYYDSLGYTGHHFKGGLAYKFYDEEYESKLRNIEWSMGKTGQITPVAIFDEIDDGESLVTRASLHNLNIINQILDHPYCGQDIKVIKANQIIPQIIWGDKRNDDLLWYFDPPKKCPCCGEDTYIKDNFLYCSNPDCDGKFINRLDHFVGKKGLDIKGLSKATLQKLINWEWVTSLKDIFYLHKYQNEWAKKDGFGPKSVMNILTTIENSKECEMWQFISALSIPLIGTNYAKEICRYCETWEQFMEYMKDFDFSKWDNFGYEMNKALHAFDFTEANDLIDNQIIKLNNSLFNEKKNEGACAGLSFCITGKLNTFKNRDEAKARIEAAGGKVVNSISGKTNYLVNNDINSTSSKNQKAKQLNVSIITEDDLLAML